MSKIKMAVFGLNQGARIARLFKENDEVELTAVAGFGQQAIDVASEVGAKLYEDYNDLLANETLDGVAIALPNSLHLSATKACCEAGIKNILLEAHRQHAGRRSSDNRLLQRTQRDTLNRPSPSLFELVSLSQGVPRNRETWRHHWHSEQFCDRKRKALLGCRMA